MRIMVVAFAIDGLLRPGYKPIDVRCADRPALCKQFGVPARP